MRCCPRYIQPVQFCVRFSYSFVFNNRLTIQQSRPSHHATSSIVLFIFEHGKISNIANRKLKYKYVQHDHNGDRTRCCLSHDRTIYEKIVNGSKRGSHPSWKNYERNSRTLYSRRDLYYIFEQYHQNKVSPHGVTRTLNVDLPHQN